MTVANAAPADDDLARAGTPGVVRSAGVALLVTGMFGVLHVIQIYGLVVAIRGPLPLLPPLMGIDPVAAIGTGLALARARSWAGLAAVVVSSVLVVAAGLWFVFALGNGIISLFGMVVPAMATVALLLAVVAK